MMQQLTPYSGQDALDVPTTVASLPGRAQGVFLTLSPDVYLDLLARIEGWFIGREEVVLVDHGTTDKFGLGFLIIEWMECEIDQLFLAILRDEELILDYTVYGRALEV